MLSAKKYESGYFGRRWFHLTRHKNEHRGIPWSELGVPSGTQQSTRPLVTVTEGGLHSERTDGDMAGLLRASTRSALVLETGCGEDVERLSGLEILYVCVFALQCDGRYIQLGR